MYFKVVTADGRHSWWFENSLVAERSCQQTHNNQLRFEVVSEEQVNAWDGGELVYAIFRQRQCPIYNLPITLV